MVSWKSQRSKLFKIPQKKMIKLGDYNTLKILRHTDPGIYLEGDETTGDILLPKRYVTPEMHDGDEVQVFVYLDQEERIIATTETPLAKVNDVFDNSEMVSAPSTCFDSPCAETSNIIQNRSKKKFLIFFPFEESAIDNSHHT